MWIADSGSETCNMPLFARKSCCGAWGHFGQQACNPVSTLLKETTQLFGSLTSCFLENTDTVLIKFCVLVLIRYRDAMEHAKDVERVLLKNVPDISTVQVQLSLSQ